MSEQTVEQRLERLEKLVAELRAGKGNGARPKDWRNTVGMFKGDPVMKEIIEAGRAIRDEDRKKEREDGV